MKVILNKDIKGVGKKNQIINASDGYAMNYLFHKKLAVPADKTNMGILQSKNQSEAYKKQQELDEAKKIAEQFKNIVVKFSVKVGENGKIFGSITPKEIAEILNSQFGIKIDKKKILTDSIKTLGVTIIDVKLYEKVIGKLKVQVEAK